METKEIIILVTALFGSTGFWGVVLAVIQNRRDKKNHKFELDDYTRQAVLAITHGLLYDLCDDIIEQDYKTPEQVEKLSYLTPPYFGLGGDGTLEELLKSVEKVKVKKP